jgi:class 3 adenylate cyclase
VHLDIDDRSIAAIGRFPWHRSVWGSIVDELSMAGVKSVALDVMFTEPEEPGKPKGVDGKEHVVDYDAVFANALSKSNRVLVPLTVSLDKPPDRSEVHMAMVDEYMADLELEDLDIVKNLQAKHINPPNLHEQVNHWVPDALSTAMFRRVKHEIESGKPADVDVLRQILLPKSIASGIRTNAVQTLEQTVPAVESFLDSLRFTRPVPAGMPPMLEQDADIPTVATLAKAASYSGFIDFLPSEDGVVRSIPLWVIDRGRMVPQIGLALACAALDVPVSAIKIDPKSVTLPLPDGREIVIPVRMVHSPNRGVDIGMFMDIPWFGGKQWETMYDYPAHLTSRQHLPVTSVWDICKIATEIERNNFAAATAAVRLVGETSSREDAQKLAAQLPPYDDTTAWNKLMADTLDNLPPGMIDDYKDYLQGRTKIEALPSEKEQQIVLSIRSLQQRSTLNDAFIKQRSDLRASLRTAIEGRTVLIGWVATGGIDFKPTPLHPGGAPGVVVHGVVFNAIMTNFFWYHHGKSLTIALTLLTGLLTTTASARLSLRPGVLAALVIAALYVAINFYVLFDWHKQLVDVAPPVVATAMVFTGCTLFQFFKEKIERGRITKRFSSYADPTLVDYIMEHPELDKFDGEDRELSIVFTDLAGFTTVSETLKKDTVPLLNEYLGLMGPAIRRHEGYINKFLGDGIMFFFNAPFLNPRHAHAAVQTVLELQEVMIPFNQTLIERGLPKLKMRAGVCTGEVSVGDCGMKDRTDYTAIGDRVNFASRLEGANKATGTLILISDRTAELIIDEYLVRPIGRLQVKGKTEPVMTFEPLARLENATPRQKLLARVTTEMVDWYIKGDFHQAMGAAYRLEHAFGDGQTTLCNLYRRLCTEYLETPPDDHFQGQIKLEEK